MSNGITNTAFTPEIASSTMTSNSTVVSISAFSPRRSVAAHQSNWRASVTSRLRELMSLPKGWDGYRGIPLTLDNAAFAFHMLEAICDDSTPAPELIPGPAGDLQIEWHTDTGSIELRLFGPNDVLAWREADDMPEGESLPLTSNFISIADWVNNLTGHGTDVAATAA